MLCEFVEAALQHQVWQAELLEVGPRTAGRNFAEILRFLDSVQLTAAEQVATPANWQQGENVIIVPAVSNEAAAEKYPDGWGSPLPYLRLVPQPGT